MTSSFRVGVSADFLENGRNVWGDIGLDRLTEAGLAWEYMPHHGEAFSASDLAPYDAVLFAAPAVTAKSFAPGVPHPALLARFGVGYDTVDLEAATANDVAITITPDGARRPVATAALTLLLAVLHNLVAKDRLVRDHRWSARTRLMGTGLSGQLVGLLGVGNTGAELVRLLQPFDVQVIGYDPFCSPERAESLGVRLVDRERLAAEADSLVIMAALTPETHHFVNAEFIELMRPSAVIVNMARGPIIDESALIQALRTGRVRAAGLDVFEEEPVMSGVETLENVTLAPHCLAWTSEMSLGNGNSCIDAILAVASGRAPSYVVNREVLDHPGFTARLEGAR